MCLCVFINTCVFSIPYSGKNSIGFLKWKWLNIILCVNVFVCLRVCVCVFKDVFVRMNVCGSVFLFVCLFVCLFICLFVILSSTPILHFLFLILFSVNPMGYGRDGANEVHMIFILLRNTFYILVILPATPNSTFYLFYTKILFFFVISVNPMGYRRDGANEFHKIFILPSCSFHIIMIRFS